MLTQIDVPLENDVKTILVVDDVESIRTSLSYMLNKKGYHVLTGSDGQEAIEIINRNNIDLVISDIAMPIINGLELVKLIKQLYRPPEILLITGEPSLETATSAVRLGIFDYITKPLNYDALMTTVHRALEKKNLLDQQERLKQQNQRYLHELEEKYDERSYHLLQTEEKYRSLFESSNVGVGVTTHDGKVLEVNEAMCKMTGYSPDELKTINLKDTIIGPIAGQRIREKLAKDRIIDDYEIKLRKANGTAYWVSLSIKPIKYRGKPAFLTIKIDITKRKEYELSLKQALADKEEMLREIHHRTKNNMNVIISLLNMQSYRLKDQHVKDILGQINDRIYSMSLVHEQIYASKELASIDLLQYIKALYLRHYGTHAGNKKEIQFDLELESSTLGLSKAIPLGLALNEVLSNVVKHPFENMSRGRVQIKLQKLPNSRLQVIVRDDGCGFPVDLNLSDPPTLGLHMAKILVEDQLSGSFILKSEKGAHVQIEFPITDDMND